MLLFFVRIFVGQILCETGNFDILCWEQEVRQGHCLIRSFVTMAKLYSIQ